MKACSIGLWPLYMHTHMLVHMDKQTRTHKHKSISLIKGLSSECNLVVEHLPIMFTLSAILAVEKINRL